jgi:hypothetical protein
MIVFWELNLAGVLGNIGMEKEAIFWGGGYGWDDWLGCAIPQV